MIPDAYTANLFAQMRCPVCGADERRGVAWAPMTCRHCAGPIPRDEAFVAAHANGADVACSFECLRSIGELAARETTCPACGAPWSSRERGNRACGTCAHPIGESGSFVGLARGGLVRGFCDEGCLDAYLRRSNPFCG